jgi:hypothetical protein
MLVTQCKLYQANARLVSAAQSGCGVTDEPQTRPCSAKAFEHLARRSLLLVAPLSFWAGCFHCYTRTLQTSAMATL